MVLGVRARRINSAPCARVGTANRGVMREGKQGAGVHLGQSMAARNRGDLPRSFRARGHLIGPHEASTLATRVRQIDAGAGLVELFELAIHDGRHGPSGGAQGPAVVINCSRWEPSPALRILPGHLNPCRSNAPNQKGAACSVHPGESQTARAVHDHAMHAALAVVARFRRCARDTNNPRRASTKTRRSYFTTHVSYGGNDKDSVECAPPFPTRYSSLFAMAKKACPAVYLRVRDYYAAP